MTPETTDYMILGFIVTAVLLLGLVTYLVLKARSLRAELHMLETLEAEGRVPTDSTETRTPRDSMSGV